MNNLIGILFSLSAGFFIVLQSAFNSKSSEKIGTLTTVVLVHGVGFVASLGVLFFKDNSNLTLKSFQSCNYLYYTGGILGVMIVLTVLNGINRLGIAYSMVFILVMQLIVSVIFDHFGLFGISQNSITLGRLSGISLMIVGIIVFNK